MVIRPPHLWLANLVEGPSQRLSQVRPPSYMCGLRLMALRRIEDLPRVTEVFLFLDKVNKIFSFGSTLCAKLDFDCIPSWSFENVSQKLSLK